MNKPITVAREDFIENLVKIINESELPIFVVRNELSRAYEQLAQIEKAQLEQDKKTWEESQKEAEDGGLPVHSVPD